MLNEKKKYWQLHEGQNNMLKRRVIKIVKYMIVIILN